ncbi:helicase-like transcription factor [Glandiceps talaboti]
MPWGWRRRRGRNTSWKQNYSSKSWKKRNNSWQEELNYLQSLQWPSYPVLDSTIDLDISVSVTGDIGDDELDHQVFLGSVRGNIVGLQYYSGVVSGQEMVALEREPENRYDRNAIKVSSAYGAQVGHIKRELAAPLAQIVDRNIARIEGMVPFGQNNVFRMPVDITLWGRPEKKTQAVEILRRHGQFMKESGTSSSSVPGIPGSSGGSGANTSTYTPRTSYGPKKALTTEQMKNELDNLFEDSKEYDKTSMEEPADAIATTLYPHQKQALAWMKARENNDDLPPFWEKRNGKYFNSLINYVTTNRPPAVKGGILADDMGLGKTLEVIALIMSNFYDGKPLAMPVVGFEKEPVKKKKVKKLSASQPASQKCKSQKASTSKTTFVVSDSEEDLNSHDSDSEAEMTNESDGNEGVDEVVPMTGKQDPEYKPKESKVKSAPVVTSPNIRSRPTRTRKKPAKYTFSSEDEEDLAEQSPKKKAKVSAKSSSGNSEKAGKGKGKGKKKGKKLSENEWEPLKGEGASVDASTGKDENEDKPTKESKGKSKKGKGKRKMKGETSITTVTGKESSEDVKTRVDAVDGQEVIDLTQSNSVSDITAASSVGGQPESFEVEWDDDSLPDPLLEHASLAVDVTGKIPAKGPRPTLIICPMSVLSNWIDQFEEHVKPNVDVSFYTYYGNERTKHAWKLEQQDVVLTTYNTLAVEFKTKGANSAVHKTEWLRVVLDEGHSIRNHKALQTKAVNALKAQRRWVLTGTPIQNSMKDLFSIISFLKVEPLNERQWWQRTMERPITQGDKNALKHVQRLMRSIAMRRTKTQKVDGKPLVELPDKKIYIQSVELSEEERTMYDTMASEGRITIGKYFKAGSLLANYGDVLAILLRLRQICCHPALCAAAVARTAAMLGNGNSATSEEMRQKLVSSLMSVLSQGSDEECCICLDSLKLPVITHCAHVFCRMCIEEVIRSEQPNAKCPLCRGEVKSEQLVQVPQESGCEKEMESMEEGEWQSSAKVDACMEALIQLRREDPAVKSIVVSQFTSLLNLMERPLSESGFHFVRLDGSMTHQKRSHVIEEFSSNDENSPTIFLLSLKAGGTGINLTAASRVFLLDPAWNPAVEDQCFDRCHRLGQTREVIVTKFVVKDSIEERMLELQDKKRNLMSDAFGKKQSAEQRRQTRINDIKTLISL